MSTTKVVSKNSKVRFSYARVFEPYAMQEGGDKKFSVSILIPKKDKALLKEIDAAVKAAIEEGKAKFGNKIPATLKLPLRDGDADYPDDETYAGMMFINASNSRRPYVVDADRNEILDKEEFYSGCWGRFSVNMYAFNTNGNKGVAVSLNGVQKLEDGERLSGGGSTASEDFGDEDEDLS